MNEMTCAELVERITDYLEGVLPAGESADFRMHLDECVGCQNYVEQMRTTLRLLQNTPPEELSPDTQDVIVRMFRDWSRKEADRE